MELKTNIVASSPGTLIAPLLFISLVENAFKHGVSNNKPSFIHLDIHQEGAEVVCTIVNSYFPKSPDQDKSGSGIAGESGETLGAALSGAFLVPMRSGGG